VSYSPKASDLARKKDAGRIQLKPSLEAPGFGAVEGALSRGPSRRGGFPSYSREDAVSVRFILSGFDHALCGVVCYAKREGCAASCSDSRKLLLTKSPSGLRQSEDCLGTEAFRPYCRHGRTHAEAPGLIRSSAHDRAVTPPGDNYWFAAQMRIIALLDGSIEGVHVDMDDFSHNLLASIPFRVSENCRCTAVYSRTAASFIPSDFPGL
jgi:hypothetical protein